jgi:type IV secretion system protein VirB6
MELLSTATDLFGGGFSIPKGIANIGDFVYYGLVYDFVKSEVRGMGPAIMKNFMSMASALALALVTIWIFWQGLRIMSGQSRESMTDFVLKAARNAFIVTAATTMSFAGGNLHEVFSKTLDRASVLLVTGKDMEASQMIEQNLLAAQVMMSSIDMVEVSEEGKLGLDGQKTRTMWIAGLGALGPAVTGAAMLLFYEIAMGLFIGFGPLFILCLMFDQTKQMFWKWLYYGIGTLFTMATLALMTTMALKVIGVVVASFWLSALASGVAGTNLTQGMSSMALQQGGIGLLLTMMLVSVPPIASQFFQGTIGNFLTQSQFGQGAAAASQRAAGQPGSGHGGSSGQAPPSNQSNPTSATSKPLSSDPSTKPYNSSQLSHESAHMGPGQKGVAAPNSQVAQTNPSIQSGQGQGTSSGGKP